MKGLTVMIETIKPNLLGDELRKVREKTLGSIEIAAKKLGVNKNTIGTYERGRTLPDIDFLMTFAEVTGADFIRLLELRIQQSPSPGADVTKAIMESIANALECLQDVESLQKQLDQYKAAESSLVAVPLYDVRAAAGHGALPAETPHSDVLHFNEAWIRQELRASPEDLYLIYVDGESMEPTLRSGDVILLDRRATKPDREGIYILRMDGMLLVKRLQALPGASVKVSSDNPAYEPFVLMLADMESQDFAILGRVVWSGRRM